MRLTVRVFFFLTAAVLISCGRTELWHNAMGGSGGSGGAFVVAAAGSGAAAEATGHGGSAGTFHVNALAGSAGSLLGGTAGAPHGGSGGAGAGGAGAGGAGAGGAGAGGAGAGGAGVGGSLHVLSACDRGATPVLDGPLAIQTKAEPKTSVVGDWNGDGKLDLATGNTDGSASVLLGSGDGSFASSVTYPSGLDPMKGPDSQGSIAASDLDGNGSLDLVLDQREGVSVLLGAADGTFAPAVTYPLLTALAGLALGDFDQDGDTDIAVGSSNNDLVVLPGNGDGTFGVGVTTPFGDRLKYISAGDLNQDGRLDILALGVYQTAVLLGDGQGRFVNLHTFETDSYDGGIELADFNADGHLDFVRSLECGPPDGARSAVDLWLGRGDGTFSDAIETTLSGICVNRLTVADVNGDGAADVLPSPRSALLGQRTGPFAPLVESTKAGGGYLLGVGDWNGDGKPDLATASDDWVEIHLGNGDGTFGSSSVYGTKAEPGSLALADFDADGDLDVATPSAVYGPHGGWGLTALNVLRGVGDGTFRERIDYDTSAPAQYPVAVDLNGDGLLDVVTVSGGWTLNAGIGVQLGTGNASFAPEMTSVLGSNVVSCAVGDLNGDGRPDVVATIGWTYGLALLSGLGDGTFTNIGSIDLPVRPTAAVLVDANGDSKADIVVALSELSAVEVLFGNGDGTFAAGQQYPIAAAPAGITAADLDADGHVDLVTWGGDSLSVLLGAGDGSFANRLDYPDKANQLVAVDFNRDRHQDLVMVHDSGITMLFGAGDGTFSCMTRYVGSSMTGLGVGDLNHDQRTDLVTTTREGVNVFLDSAP